MHAAAGKSDSILKGSGNRTVSGFPFLNILMIKSSKLAENFILNSS